MTPLDYVKAGVAALLLSAAFFGGCSVQKNIDTANVNKARAETAALERKLDKEAKDHAQWKLDETIKKQRDIAALDKKHTEERERAKTEYQNTIASLRAGNLSVRPRLTCPATASNVATSTGVSDDQAPAGLQVQDAEFLLSEAERADEVVRQLTEAQDIIVQLQDALEKLTGQK